VPSVEQLFLGAARHHSDRPAFWLYGTFVNYAELHEQARIAAAILAAANHYYRAQGDVISFALR
jgi:hypothetical protein